MSGLELQQEGQQNSENSLFLTSVFSSASGLLSYLSHMAAGRWQPQLPNLLLQSQPHGKTHSLSPIPTSKFPAKGLCSAEAAAQSQSSYCGQMLPQVRDKLKVHCKPRRCSKMCPLHKGRAIDLVGPGRSDLLPEGKPMS